MSQPLLEKYNIKERLKELYTKIKPTPSSSLFLLDILFLFLFIILQFILNNFILYKIFMIDIITPWLILYYVKQNTAKSAILFIIVSFILETHSNVPKGSYYCIYFLIWSSLFLTKNNLYWTQISTWMAVFSISELIIILFLTVMLYLSDANVVLSIIFIIKSLLFIIFSMFIGIGYLKIYNNSLNLNINFKSYKFFKS